MIALLPPERKEIARTLDHHLDPDQTDASQAMTQLIS
jgi:hypothetical protein